MTYRCFQKPRGQRVHAISKLRDEMSAEAPLQSIKLDRTNPSRLVVKPQKDESLTEGHINVLARRGFIAQPVCSS